MPEHHVRERRRGETLILPRWNKEHKENETVRCARKGETVQRRFDFHIVYLYLMIFESLIVSNYTLHLVINVIIK